MRGLTPAQILDAPACVRKGIHLRSRVHKRRKGRVREKRERLSRDELIDYLRKHEFDSKMKLSRGRSPGDPTERDYSREFGTWGQAKELAFYKSSLPCAGGNISHIILTAMLQYKIRTAEQYREARRRRPDVIPSIYRVGTEFGKWNDLMECVAMKNLSEIVRRYKVLIRKNGGKPLTLEEAEKRGAYIRDVVYRLFGGRKKKFDAWIMGK